MCQALEAATCWSALFSCFLTYESLGHVTSTCGSHTIGERPFQDLRRQTLIPARLFLHQTRPVLSVVWHLISTDRPASEGGGIKGCEVLLIVRATCDAWNLAHGLQGSYFLNVNMSIKWEVGINLRCVVCEFYCVISIHKRSLVKVIQDHVFFVKGVMKCP